MEKLFREWLETNKKLSDSSIGKYTRAIRAITKDMLSEGVISKDLYDITSAVEFDNVMKIIFSDNFFSKKDTRGNRMYSVAMNHYYEFLESRE